MLKCVDFIALFIVMQLSYTCGNAPWALVVETWKLSFQFKISTEEITWGVLSVNHVGLYYDETVVLKFVYFWTVLMFVSKFQFILQVRLSCFHCLKGIKLNYLKQDFKSRGVKDLLLNMNTLSLRSLN